MFFKEKITASFTMYDNELVISSLKNQMNAIINNHEDYVDSTILNQLLMLLVVGTRYEYHYIKNISDIIAKDYELPIALPVWDFMGYASHSRDNDLDLCRQAMIGDNVVISQKIQFKLARAIVQYEIKPVITTMKQRIKEYKMDEKLNPIRKKVFEDITIPLNIINEKTYNGDIGNVEVNNLPPCMKGIIEDILCGNSPNHFARRSFSVFYFCAKYCPTLRCFDDEKGGIKQLKAQDIVGEEEIHEYIEEMNQLFGGKDGVGGVDDYNRYKTTYYLLNNIGYSSNRLMYCEYCKKFKTDSNLSMYCKPDETCSKRGVIHPLDYYIEKSVI